jgi:hypothetical protein
MPTPIKKNKKSFGVLKSDGKSDVMTRDKNFTGPMNLKQDVIKRKAKEKKAKIAELKAKSDKLSDKWYKVDKEPAYMGVKFKDKELSKISKEWKATNKELTKLTGKGTSFYEHAKKKSPKLRK